MAALINSSGVGTVAIQSPKSGRINTPPVRLARIYSAQSRIRGYAARKANKSPLKIKLVYGTTAAASDWPGHPLGSPPRLGAMMVGSVRCL
jgi:hypothetical protein